MLMFRLLQVAPAVVLAVFGLSSALHTVAADKRVSAIETGRVSVEDSATKLLKSSKVHDSREWISVASILSAENPGNDRESIALLERALAVDPHHPDAWSLLAFLRAREASEFTDLAASALRESNERCSLCNRAELKWRLTFTLRHWDQVPEDLRISAFIGADFLRWWYLESEFLRQVGRSAIEMEIPFGDYRRMVRTPVRPNEIP